MFKTAENCFIQSLLIFINPPNKKTKVQVQRLLNTYLEKKNEKLESIFLTMFYLAVITWPVYILNNLIRAGFVSFTHTPHLPQLLWSSYIYFFLSRIMASGFPIRILRHGRRYIRKWKLKCPQGKHVSFGDLEQMFTFLLFLRNNICLLHWFVYWILI